jgi:hypothetical protein
VSVPKKQNNQKVPYKTNIAYCTIVNYLNVN